MSVIYGRSVGNLKKTLLRKWKHDWTQIVHCRYFAKFMSLYESACQDGHPNKTYIDMQCRNLWETALVSFSQKYKLKRKLKTQNYDISMATALYWKCIQKMILPTLVHCIVLCEQVFYNELKNKMAATEVFRSTKDPYRKMF